SVVAPSARRRGPDGHVLGAGPGRPPIDRVRRAPRARGGGVGGARLRVHGGLESPPVAARPAVRPDGDRPRLPPGAGRASALVLAHARLSFRGPRLDGG